MAKIQRITIWTQDGAEFDIRADSLVTDPNANHTGTCEAYKSKAGYRQFSARVGSMQLGALLKEAEPIVTLVNEQESQALK